MSVRIGGRHLLSGFLTLCLLLSGCGTLPHLEKTIFSEKPQSGQCWQATNRQASEWMNWEGSAPVSCTKKHTLETVGIAIVEGEYSGTGLGGSDEYSAEFKDAAGRSCAKFWTKSVAGLTKPHRVINFLFYPSPKKFVAGERWVRCDLGVYDVGTAWSPDAFELQVLQKRFLALKSDAAFALCLDSSGDEVGSQGEALEVADCGLPHRWNMVRASDLSVSVNEEYPGADEVNSRAEVSCNFKKPRSVTGWFWQTPSKGQWLAGDRVSFCWWANSDPPTSQALAKRTTPEG